MFDAFNTPLKKEARIAWAGRKGADMWLSWGTVREVDDRHCKVLRIFPAPVRFVTLKNFNTIVRIL